MRALTVPVLFLSAWLSTGCVGTEPTDVSSTGRSTGESTTGSTTAPAGDSSPSPSSTSPRSPLPSASSPAAPSRGSSTGPSADPSSVPSSGPSGGQEAAAPAPVVGAPTGSTPAVPNASDECWGLLTAEGKQHGTEQASDGLTYLPDFETTAASADPETFGRMIEYGGTLCSVGFDRTDNVWIYGHSLMDDSGMADLRALLTSRSYQSKASANGEVLCLPNDYTDDCFLFGSSEIFFSSAESVLPDLVAGAHDA